MKTEFKPWPINHGEAHNRETCACPRTTGAAHGEARPIRATLAHDGKARARRPLCENTPNLPTNHPEIHDTISTDSYFIDKPLE